MAGSKVGVFEMSIIDVVTTDAFVSSETAVCSIGVTTKFADIGSATVATTLGDIKTVTVGAVALTTTLVTTGSELVAIVSVNRIMVVVEIQ